MSAMGILETPKTMDFTESTPSSLVLPLSMTPKVLVEDQVFDIEDSTTTSLPLGKLRSTEGGAYRFPDEWNVHATQFSALFDHLQFGKQLETFNDISSVLTLSSPSRLDLPETYNAAKESLISSFPHKPTPYEFGQSEEALLLAIEHGVKPVQKVLYYALITHTNIGVDDPSELSKLHPILHSRPEIIETSQHLQSQLVSHFTPILFTVSTAGHMPCTDAIAEHWMTSVIGPALSDPTGGVSAPIEALQKVCEIDWTELGLCEECVRDKREEWKGEVDTIWKKIDEWLSIP